MITELLPYLSMAPWQALQLENTAANTLTTLRAGSFLFFYSVGFGARLLSPLFSRARAWQWLEASVGVVMLLLAYNLMHTNLG